MYFFSLSLMELLSSSGREAGGHHVAEERHGDLAVGTDHVLCR